MKRKKKAAVIAAVAMPSLAMLMQPAAATEPPPDVPVQGTTNVTVEQLDSAGNVISGKTLSLNGLAAASNVDGGTSSPEGCLRVTVNNEFESSILQETLFWYHTSLTWCWNRAAGTISRVSTDWWPTDIAWNWRWEGEVSHNRGFYEWQSGYKSSGYKTDRTGHFSGGCVFSVPCSNLYPHNVIRGHSNGTYSWFAN